MDPSFDCYEGYQLPSAPSLLLPPFINQIITPADDPLPALLRRCRLVFLSL